MPTGPHPNISQAQKPSTPAAASQPGRVGKKTPRFKGMLIRLPLILLAIYFAWCVLVYVKQTALIYPAPSLSRSKDATVPTMVERLWLRGTDRNEFEAWVVTPPHAATGQRFPALLYCHANAELIDHNLHVAESYTNMGFVVMLAEYRGYGHSAGTPNENGIVGDLCLAFDQLAQRPDVRRDRILLHGRSLGGGIAAQVALARPALAGLILESTFTRVTALAPPIPLPPGVLKSRYDTIGTLPKLGCPVLILHGTGDGMIPISHGRALHAAAPGSTLVELDGGHNDFPRDTDAYWKAIDAFLAEHRLTPSGDGQ